MSSVLSRYRQSIHNGFARIARPKRQASDHRSPYRRGSTGRSPSSGSSGSGNCTRPQQWRMPAWSARNDKGASSQSGPHGWHTDSHTRSYRSSLHGSPCYGKARHLPERAHIRWDISRTGCPFLSLSSKIPLCSISRGRSPHPHGRKEQVSRQALKTFRRQEHIRPHPADKASGNLAWKGDGVQLSHTLVSPTLI